MTRFTDGSDIKMSNEEVENAKTLFDAELEKFAKANYPRADAMSIKVHTAVGTPVQNRRPILAEGEEATTEHYECVFEDEYDGDVPNLLVGLEFPKRYVLWWSESARENIGIPFWQFVIRKLSESLLEEGAASSRDLRNMETLGHQRKEK